MRRAGWPPASAVAIAIAAGLRTPAPRLVEPAAELDDRVGGRGRRHPCAAVIAVATMADGRHSLPPGHTVASGIARATIDHPPVNLFDVALMVELDRFGREVEADDEVRVVVVDSADPEFFIAHADVGLILAVPHEAPAAEGRGSGSSTRRRPVPHDAEGDHRCRRGPGARRRERIRVVVRHALRGDRPRRVRPAGGRAGHHPRRQRDPAAAAPRRAGPGASKSSWAVATSMR